MSEYPIVHITDPVKAWDPREVIVHIVTKKPEMAFLTIGYGITTEASALIFGEKTNCSEVYWIRNSQRAYGVRREVKA